MQITVEAVYEDGVLKVAQPLPLQEQERVQVTVHSSTSSLLSSYGIVGFNGTSAEGDYFAMDPELDYPAPVEDS